ncbi:uncharacterized protein V2V93DRAFT_368495 [Kockiozyma suomiensis]|uniref:uncharacterized protein n=1 Tax=Kockiozyma suomiensis TaxID=1337062 RepID=UPI0033442DA7
MGLALALSAELTGVTDLHPIDTQEEPYVYSFKVQCTSCREIHPNFVELTSWETHDLSGSRGEANFVWRCKSCRRESSASFKSKPQPYTLEDSGKLKNIIELETRGLEFLEFKVEGAWSCRSSENEKTKFEEIDLQEGEWFEYDEKAGEEVMITDIKWEIRRS